MFISNNLSDIKKAKEFAQNNQYQFKCCSVEKWHKNNKKEALEEDLPTPALMTSHKKAPHNSNIVAVKKPWGRERNFFNTLDELKIRAIRDALIVCRGNITKAADILQVGRATLYRNTKILNIPLSDLRNYQENSSPKKPFLINESKTTPKDSSSNLHKLKKSA